MTLPFLRHPGSRRGWDTRATWLCLAYDDPRPVEVALNRLSRHTERIGLRWRANDLYAGLVEPVLVGVLVDMAADWHFQVTAATNMPPRMIGGRFVPATELIAVSAGNEQGVETAVDAYLVRERLFVLNPAARRGGYRFPSPKQAIAPAGEAWHLPYSADPSCSQKDCYLPDLNPVTDVEGQTIG